MLLYWDECLLDSKLERILRHWWSHIWKHWGERLSILDIGTVKARNDLNSLRGVVKRIPFRPRAALFQ